MLFKTHIDTSAWEENWPAHYHEIEDPALKEQILTKHIEASHDPDDERRLQLFHQRYGRTKKHYDRWMRAWLSLKTISANHSGLFLSSGEARDVRNALYDLNITHEEPDDLLVDEWKDFAETMIRCFSEDSTYGSPLGLVRLGDGDKARRIAEMIHLSAEVLPAKVHMSEETNPFAEVLIHTYCERIQNGKKYWEEICSH